MTWHTVQAVVEKLIGLARVDIVRSVHRLRWMSVSMLSAPIMDKYRVTYREYHQRAGHPHYY